MARQPREAAREGSIASVSSTPSIGGTRLALVALAVTVALWGSAFAAIRVGLEGFAPADLAALRLSTASIALALVAAVSRLERPGRGDIRSIVVCGLTGVAAYQLLLNVGEVTVPAGVANVLAGTSLLFTALMAVTFLGEHMSQAGWIGTAIAFAGTVIVSFGASQGQLRVEPRAAIVLAAAVMLATFFVVEKPVLSRLGSLTVTAYATWIGTLALLPLTARLPQAVAEAEPEASLAAVYLGIGPSALGYLTWAYAVARVDVAFASSTLYLAPVFAFGTAWLLQGEVPTLVALVGGVVAVVGVAMTSAARRGADPGAPDVATRRPSGSEGRSRRC